MWELAVDGREVTRKEEAKRSQMFYKPIDVHFVINATGKSVSSVSMYNITNQLGNYDFSCG